MSDKAKGRLQLILVIAFIAGSILLSKALTYTVSPPQTQSGGDRAVFVETEVIERGRFPITFTSSGVVEARSNVSIIPQVSGRIVHINPNFFTDGRFKKNELLFQIERSDYHNEVERLKAQIAAAQTALALEKARAQTALDEWKLLHPDKAPSDLVARKPQLAEAESSLQAAKAQLATASLNLSRTRFSLPFHGRVVQSSLALGQVVSAGQSYGSVFSLDALEVQTSLSDSQLSWLVTAGKDASITVEATHLGKTSRYSAIYMRGGATLDAGTRFSSVNLAFTELPRSLVPGVFVTVNVTSRPLDDVMRLPSKALQKEGIVWLVDEGNTLKKLTPEILYEDENQVVIRAGMPNARIVTSRLAGAMEGMQVQLREPAP